MSFSTTLREGVPPPGKKEAVNNGDGDFGRNIETGDQNMSGSKRVGFPSCSLEAQHSPPFHPRISLFCIVLFIPISPIQVQVPSVHGKYMLHGY